MFRDLQMTGTTLADLFGKYDVGRTAFADYERQRRMLESAGGAQLAAADARSLIGRFAEQFEPLSRLAEQHRFQVLSPELTETFARVAAQFQPISALSDLSPQLTEKVGELAAQFAPNSLVADAAAAALRTPFEGVGAFASLNLPGLLRNWPTGTVEAVQRALPADAPLELVAEAVAMPQPPSPTAEPVEWRHWYINITQTCLDGIRRAQSSTAFTFWACLLFAAFIAWMQIHGSARDKQDLLAAMGENKAEILHEIDQPKPTEWPAVTTRSAIVRTEPNSSGQPLARLPPQTAITLFDCEGHWCRCEYRQGESFEQGWIYRQFVQAFPITARRK
jgi:hypothetical protein